MNTHTSVTPPAPPAKPAPTGIAFELTLGSNTYVSPDAAAVQATLQLRNHTQTPVTLAFIDGQQFDLEMRDSSGALIRRWSTGRTFSDLAHTIEVVGDRTWTGSLPAPVLAGPVVPFPPGPVTTSGGGAAPSPTPEASAEPELIDLNPVPYTLTGYLTTAGAAMADSSETVRPYSATVAFTVRLRPVVPET